MSLIVPWAFLGLLLHLQCPYLWSAKSLINYQSSALIFSRCTCLSNSARYHSLKIGSSLRFVHSMLTDIRSCHGNSWFDWRIYNVNIHYRQCLDQWWVIHLLVITLFVSSSMWGIRGLVVKALTSNHLPMRGSYPVGLLRKVGGSTRVIFQCLHYHMT